MEFIGEEVKLCDENICPSPRAEWQKFKTVTVEQTALSILDTDTS